MLILLPATIAGSWWSWEKCPDSQGAPGLREAAELLETTGEATSADEEIGQGKTPYRNTGDSTYLQIYVVQTGALQEIELEDYVRGVIAAEMPASFHPEALKAQAVAARTYACHRNSPGGGGCPRHPGAALCTESSCCQAWLDDHGARGKWPTGEADSYLERIAEAVRSTRGQVLTYDGELIAALYHSTCGGKTEAAAELWSDSGSSYPYLQSVDCPYCRGSPTYRQEVGMEFSAYAAALQGEKEALPVFAGGNLPLLEVVQKSASGRNLLLRLGRPGRLYSGSEVRRLLGLPSTRFCWRVEEEKIIFSVQGNGHGVGMCQYGANGLALTGMDYSEILSYYYRGAVLENLATRSNLLE